MYTDMYTHRHIHTDTYTHACTHVHTYTHTHTHTHKHTGFKDAAIKRKPCNQKETAQWLTTYYTYIAIML